MNTMPREEPVIVKETSALKAERKRLVAVAKMITTARATAEAELVRAEAALTDSEAEAAYQRPAWVTSRRWLGAAWVVEQVQKVLAEIGLVEVYGHNPQGDKWRRLALSAETLALVPELADGVPPNIPGRLAEIGERLSVLAEELAVRRAGPGERRLYRILGGSISRFEDGNPQSKIYKRDAVIGLDTFEYLSANPSRLQAVEAGEAVAGQ